MFFERLTDEQLMDFANEVTGAETDLHGANGWELKIERLTKGKVIDIVMVQYLENHENRICIRIFGDYKVIVLGLGSSAVFSYNAKKIYVKHMYRIFGEEYKNAYLANAAKIFE